MATTSDTPSFFSRLSLAFRILGSAKDAGLAAKALSAPETAAAPEKTSAPVAPAPVVAPVAVPAAPAEPDVRAGLLVLGLLQREGRLVDFLREDVAAYGDADIGAAARVVHAGCRKVLDQYFTFEPAMPGADGDAVTLAAGFDAQRVRLTGNVAGQPPFRGTLRHHGWVVSSTRLPVQAASVDARVIAAAEVEL